MARFCFGIYISDCFSNIRRMARCTQSVFMRSGRSFLITDSPVELKYTDIDYVVFSDAARFVYQGQSPFMRATYRYTPLLSVTIYPSESTRRSAWLMVPNAALHPAFGKVLFCAVDMIIGWLLLQVLTKFLPCAFTRAHLTLLISLWLLNPISINVSSRGNAESIVASLVLLTLYLLFTRKLVASAITSACRVDMGKDGGIPVNVLQKKEVDHPYVSGGGGGGDLGAGLAWRCTSRSTRYSTHYPSSFSSALSSLRPDL